MMTDDGEEGIPTIIVNHADRLINKRDQLEEWVGTTSNWVVYKSRLMLINTLYGPLGGMKNRESGNKYTRLNNNIAGKS